MTADRRGVARRAAAVFLSAGVLLTASAPAGAVSFAPAPKSPFPAGSVPQSVAIADFTLDGRLDLAVANSNSRDVSILIGDGRGGFIPAAVRPRTGAEPVDIAAADLDADGAPDLVAANAGESAVSVLLGDGAGGFRPAAGSPEPVNGRPQAITQPLDLNGDGNLDVAAVAEGSHGLTVLLGDGTGDLAPASAAPPEIGTSARDVAAADVDTDGDVDLAVVDASSRVVLVLLGDGEGRFSPGTAGASPFTAAGVQPQAATLWDLDGEGRPDVAVALRASDAIDIGVASFAGGFTRVPGAPLPAPEAPAGVAAGNLDDDEVPDLAVAGASSADVTVFPGAGAATFGAPQRLVLSPGAKPGAVAIADVDDNGRADLVVPSTVTDGEVHVLLAEGKDPPPPIPPAHAPAAAIPAAPDSSAPPERPRPELAKTVVLTPRHGEVLVRTRRNGPFVPLQSVREVPVGSVVDAARGRVLVESAADTAGTVQGAAFHGGVFRVRQRRARRPVTELRLAGQELSRCPRSRRSARTSGGRSTNEAAAAARRRRTVRRRLWGSGRGRFRTRGRYSSATVRGTTWLSEDRCDGTLTRVRRGSVTVRDFVRRRTVVVRAGRGHFTGPGARRTRR